MATNEKEAAIIDGPEYNANGHTQYVDPVTGIETKEGRILEAGEIYGNLADAEEYGYVTRGLKSRHIQFIALGGTIGTGLFLGIGGAFTQAGPLSVLLGYTFTGIAIFAMMQCLGEMATWLPLPGAIPQFCARYADDALGFAVGWNNWYSNAITLCAEISAASIVIDYWHPGVNVAVWISILIVLVIGLNIFAVAIYGEAEFVFASVKIITIVGLLIMAFIIDVGGGPKRDRLGFRFWKDPGAMLEYDGTGDAGRFLGLFSVLVNAAFSYGGVELVAVAAGEAENPRKNIPKAVRRVFWRILFFYILGSLAIGVLVSSKDEHLLKAQKDDAAGAAQSPWVIGIQNAGIPVLPSIINAVILTSASSSANAFLYTGSRYLFALAQNRQAPRFLLRCSKAGVPYWCVLITASIACLTYLSVGKGGAQDAFLWFQNLTTIASLFTWCSICLAYIQFHKALKAQGIDRNTLVFRSRFQPYTAWFSFGYFAMIIIFNGFDVFVHGHWKVDSFIASYIGIPIYFALYFFWKIFKKTKWIHPADADITTGKAALDAEVWPSQVPRNVWEKIWFFIA
ncbi:putative proline-specific permease put4 [Venustampulla echinocandica]|uniref:Putative proline-specific permease put4 n=1 Tax=Venustampulla echinocandica TaxID=2656787 RepID=A0A370TUR7_9HELO|nr:putative proline-specific permease put4 [Venustampulla echinocandica]RDL39218.1 putative proline-specific permease put4 [Venustampulla echinocandica]